MLLRSPSEKAILYESSYLMLWKRPAMKMMKRSNLLNVYHVCMLSHFSHVRLFEAPWTVAHQAPLTMGLSQHKDWSGLLFPPSGHLPDPGI